MQVSILRPNGVENNSYDGRVLPRYFLINTYEEIIPLREDVMALEMSDLNWGSYNPDNQSGWEVVTILSANNSDQAFGIQLFDYTSEGEQDWLVSPLLDMSYAPTANMVFDLSYAQNDSLEDVLEIKVSTDCGATFPFTVFRATSQDLSEDIFNGSWKPESPEDWQKIYVDLDEFAGMNPVRLAFISTNGNGNNMYLDNIELYETGFTQDIRLNENSVLIHPNPSRDGIFYMTVNTPERQKVNMRILDSMGRLVMEKEMEALLNQTIEFDLNGKRNGIYLIQISGQTFNKIQRVIINK
jgi:hypothetical protein